MYGYQSNRSNPVHTQPRAGVYIQSLYLCNSLKGTDTENNNNPFAGVTSLPVRVFPKPLTLENNNVKKVNALLVCSNTLIYIRI